MQEKKRTLKELQKVADKFVTERQWDEFHNPKNDSMNVAREASELSELFLWTNSPQESIEQVEKLRDAVEDEAGDVLFALLCFCESSNVDLEQAFLNKLKKTEKKYPIETANRKKFNKIKYGIE